MRIVNEFEVPADHATVWAAMTDLPRIAPCMPGARIDCEVKEEPGAYSGHFAIKIGPVRARYAGTLRMDPVSQDGSTIVLRGSGTDAAGAGSVSATITAALHAHDARSRIEMVSDIDVQGRLAQFTGRSSMVQSIADQIISQFAGNLRAEILAPRTVPSSDAGLARGSTPRPTSDRKSSISASRNQSASASSDLNALALLAGPMKDLLGARCLGWGAAGLLLGVLLGRRSPRARMVVLTGIDPAHVAQSLLSRGIR